MGESEDSEALLTIGELDREFRHLAELRRRHSLYLVAAFLQAYRGAIALALVLFIVGWLLHPPIVFDGHSASLTPVWTDRAPQVPVAPMPAASLEIHLESGMLCRNTPIPRGLRNASISRVPRCDRLSVMNIAAPRRDK